MPEVDNPAALKHLISFQVVKEIGRTLAATADGGQLFNRPKFIAACGTLTNLELKQRVELVSQAMHDALPANYPRGA